MNDDVELEKQYGDLLKAVHDLLDEIDNCDYVDMVGSDVRLSHVKELAHWVGRSTVDFDPFAAVLFNGGGSADIERVNRETMTFLPPMGCLTDEAIIRVMDKAMQEITNGSNTFNLTANKVWSAIIRATADELQLGGIKNEQAIQRTC